MTEDINPIPSQLHSWRFILLAEHTKIPLAEMKGWSTNRETQTYTHDSETLKNHIANGGNYGVTADKDRFIIAADTKDIEHAIEKHLPPTFTVKSPRHQTKHFYYYGTITKPIQCKPTAQGDPCADIKYGNSYVLGPGSTFNNHGKYEIVDNRPIANLTEEALKAALDQFIVPHKTIEPETIRGESNPELNFQITQLIQNLGAYTQNGNEIYGPHPKHGSTTGNNFHINHAKNVWHCFRAGHESGGGPLELLAVLEGILNCEDCHKGALRGDKFKQTIKLAKERGYIKNLPFTPKNNGDDEDQQINMLEILNHFNTQYIYKTPTDTEEIYRYKDGLYIEAEHEIKTLLENWLQEKATTHLVEEVLNHLRRGSYTDRAEFNKTSAYLPTQTGLLNMNTLQIEPFNQEKIYTYKLTIKYDAQKECPQFQKFLTEILEPEDIPTLQEYLGYCLLTAMPYHKMMWFYGTGRNGKGRVIATLEALIGKDNCSYLTLEEFYGDHRFSVANLYGKMANIASEPNTKRALQTSLIKKVTGEDTIDAEIKNKQKFLKFKNFAKFFILGNRFPRVNDNTIAFWDRVIMLKFPYSFTNEKQIPNIEKRWTTNPDEMSGILNWALTGLNRLNTNNKFTESKNAVETTSEFKRASDSVLAFIGDQCTFNKDNIIPRGEVYNIYKEYCDLYGLEIEDERTFVARVKQLPKIHAVSKRIEGAVTRVWVGLQVKPLSSIDDTVTDVTSETLIISQGKQSSKDIVKKSTVITCNGVTPVTPQIDQAFFSQCFFCGNPIVTDDWKADETTNYKPAHVECWKKNLEMIKNVK